MMQHTYLAHLISGQRLFQLLETVQCAVPGWLGNVRVLEGVQPGQALLIPLLQNLKHFFCQLFSSPELSQELTYGTVDVVSPPVCAAQAAYQPEHH